MDRRVVDDSAGADVGVRVHSLMSVPPEANSELSDIERERMILRHGIEQDSRRVRIAGIVGMGLGMILLVMIGTIAWLTVPIMLAGGAEVDGTRFSGGPEAAMLVIGIYALVAAIGLMAMVNGALHVATGRRFAKPLRLMMGLFFLFVIAGMAARALG
jgi:hypothetical protein